MAVSPPPHLPTTSNNHPTAADHLRDGVEAAGAAFLAAHQPTTALEMVSAGTRFDDDSSADPTTAASQPFSLSSTDNHRPIVAEDLRDGEATVAVHQTFDTTTALGDSTELNVEVGSHLTY